MVPESVSRRGWPGGYKHGIAALSSHDGHLSGGWEQTPSFRKYVGKVYFNGTPRDEQLTAYVRIGEALAGRARYLQFGARQRLPAIDRIRSL